MKDKILQISKELGLSHIGSNISVLPILEEIYAKKKPGDIVILDNAHAHLAHLTQLFNVPIIIKDLIKKYGIHCDTRATCDASGGSLGHGLGISIGYALANPKSTIYCIVSDGSMHEGSNWEALRLLNTLKIKNLKLHLNFNGYSAVAEVDDRFINGIRLFWPVIVWKTKNGEGFEGVQGHYKKYEG